MRHSIPKLLIIGIALLLGGWRFADKEAKQVTDFKLKDVDGIYKSLADYPEAKGFMVVFICNHCPMAKQYYSKLNTLDAAYKTKGYPLIAINPMDSLLYEEETWEGMAKVAKAKKMQYPYLQDPTQSVGKQFGVTHTPQAFVLTKNVNGTFKVAYEGAIDNGSNNILISYLAQTIDLLIAKKEIKEPSHAAIGCAVYYRK